VANLSAHAAVLIATAIAVVVAKTKICESLTFLFLHRQNGFGKVLLLPSFLISILSFFAAKGTAKAPLCPRGRGCSTSARGWDLGAELHDQAEGGSVRAHHHRSASFSEKTAKTLSLLVDTFQRYPRVVYVSRDRSTRPCRLYSCRSWQMGATRSFRWARQGERHPVGP